MSLSDELRQMREEFIQQMPEEVVISMQKATQKLIDTGIDKRALRVGERIPPFFLPNANGLMVSSKELLAKGPLVINFYRGGWCPYCNLELKAFQDALPRIKSLGAQLVAISPNLPDNSLDSIEKHALEFEVLSDLKNTYADQFGLVFTLDVALQSLYTQFEIDIPFFNGEDSYQIPLPATYVVDSQGIVRLAFVDADYTKRLEPDEVIKSLKEMD